MDAFWVWKISPKNPKFFNFFLFGSKSIPGSKTGLALYLLRVKSMLRSGQGLSLVTIFVRVGFIITKRFLILVET